MYSSSSCAVAATKSAAESACFSTVATLRPPQCPPARPSAKRLRMAKFQPAPRSAPPAPTAASFRAPKSCRPSTVGQTAT
eukprot:5073491-Alexandrium_andersonii.AAC.1